MKPLDRSIRERENPWDQAGPDDPPIRPLGVYLRYLAGLVRRHIVLVVGAAMMVGGLAGWLLWRTPLRYQAAAAVRIADSRQALTAGIDGSPERGFGVGGIDLLQTQMEILRSTRVIGRAVDESGVRLRVGGEPGIEDVIERLDVEAGTPVDHLILRFAADSVTVESPSVIRKLAYGNTVDVQGVRFIVHERPSGATRALLEITPRDEAIARASANLDVVPRRQTGILDVRFTSGSPHYAMTMVNHIVEAFRAVDLEVAQQQARRRREFFEQQVAANDSLLERAQLSLSEFRARNFVGGRVDRTTAREIALADVELRKGELEAQKRTYTRLLEDVRSASVEARGDHLRVLIASPGISSSPAINHLYSQLLTYQTARDTMLSSGSQPTHPDVQQFERLLDSVESRLLLAVQSQVESLDTQIAALEQLRQTTAGEIAAAIVPPATEVREMQLADQLETIEEMAGLVRAEYQRARVEEAVEAGLVEILDLATRPGRPVSNGQGRKLSLAVIVGLLLGCGLAYVRESVDIAVHAKEDLESVVGVPTLATVPRLSPNGHRRTGVNVRAGGTGSAREAERQAYLHGLEAFRMLGASLGFSPDGEAQPPPRTVLVTSPFPGEGKSTTAVNLAMAQAEAGKRVLIIDCDVIRPVVHAMVKVGRTPGLIQVLQEDVPVQRAARPTRYGFDVLPVGMLESGASATLGEARVRKMLRGLEDRYDRIILDAPPVMLMANALVLAKISHAVVLVIRSGRTDYVTVQHAIDQLRLVGARLIGTVLNDPDGELSRYNGGSYLKAYERYFGG